MLWKALPRGGARVSRPAAFAIPERRAPEHAHTVPDPNRRIGKPSREGSYYLHKDKDALTRRHREHESVEKVTKAHPKQVLTYPRLTGIRLGCLLDFGDALMREGISRIINGDVA